MENAAKKSKLSLPGILHLPCAKLIYQLSPDSFKDLKYPEYRGKLCYFFHLEVLQQISILLIEIIPEKQTPMEVYNFKVPIWKAEFLLE